MRPILSKKLAPLFIRRSISLSCFALLFLLTACGKKEESNIANDTTTNFVHEIPTENLEESKLLSKNSTIDCEDNASCIPQVAMLIISKPKSVALCTSFLIAENILATNSHCIPKEIKNGSLSCSENISAIFPAHNQLKEEKISCAQLIKSSPLTNISSPDYAFIKLSKNSTRTPLHVNQDGLENNSNITLYKIDPIEDNNDSKKPKGLLRKEECKVIQNSFVMPSFISAKCPEVSIANCILIPGNSGSPLINSNNKVSAIAHGTIKIETSNIVQKILDEFMGGETPSPLFVASNFSCITSPHDKNLKLSEECITPENAANYYLIEEKTSPNLEQNIQNELNIWAQNNQKYFQWNVDIKTSNYQKSYKLEPSCINLNLEKESLLELPSTDLKIRFNRYFQSTVEESKKTTRTHIKISRGKNLKSAHVAILDNESENIIFDQDLPYCSKN